MPPFPALPGWAQAGAAIPMSVHPCLHGNPHLLAGEYGCWARGQALPPVFWYPRRAAVAADSGGAWKGCWLSCSGWATRLRWPLLSLRRCTDMVPVEQGEGRLSEGRWAMVTAFDSVNSLLPSPTPGPRRAMGTGLDWFPFPLTYPGLTQAHPHLVPAFYIPSVPFGASFLAPSTSHHRPSQAQCGQPGMAEGCWGPPLHSPLLCVCLSGQHFPGRFSSSPWEPAAPTRCPGIFKR